MQTTLLVVVLDISGFTGSLLFGELGFWVAIAIGAFALSRVREFDADLKSAVITGDPLGLAYALTKIEQHQRSWLSILLPGWGIILSRLGVVVIL